MSFSPRFTALEGFRLTRREPRLVLFLALLHSAVLMLAFAINPEGVRQLLVLMQQIVPGTQLTEAQSAALMQASFNATSTVILPVLLLEVVTQAAIARGVLTPGKDHLGFLRLGRDEVRVMGTCIVVWLAMTFAMFAALMIVGLIAGIAMAGVQALMLVAMAVGVAAAVGMVWLAVKFMLSVPISMTEQKVGVIDSFKATSGLFWPLLGTVGLAFLLAMAVGILVALIGQPFMSMTGGLEGFAEGKTGVVMLAGVAVWVLFNALANAAKSVLLYAPLTAVWAVLRHK